MNEERISAARADMERRVAEFREKQAKFQREREDYYETTIEKVLGHRLERVRDAPSGPPRAALATICSQQRQ